MKAWILVVAFLVAACGAARTDAGAACPEPSSVCTSGATYCDPSSRARAWVCLDSQWSIVSCASKLAPYYAGDDRAGCAGTSDGSECFGAVCR